MQYISVFIDTAKFLRELISLDLKIFGSALGKVQLYQFSSLQDMCDKI